MLHRYDVREDDLGGPYITQGWVLLSKGGVLYLLPIYKQPQSPLSKYAQIHLRQTLGNMVRYEIYAP
jgi:hypothetical protein